MDRKEAIRKILSSIVSDKQPAKSSILKVYSFSSQGAQAVDEQIIDGQATENELFEVLALLLDILAASQASPVPSSRQQVYKVCHGIAKDYDIYRQLRQLIKVRWGCESMTQLGDKDLGVLYRFMRALEAHISWKLVDYGF